MILRVSAALAACLTLAVAPVLAGAQVGESRPTAVVTRDGDRWTVELRLDQDAPVWGFTRSSQMQENLPQWRPTQWRVETPGVVLDRLGSRDVLRRADGGPVPRRIRLALTPASARVAAAYNPALVFSDGSVALFSGQFDIFPLASIQAAKDLPEDLNGLDLGAEATWVTWRDLAGPILFRGARVPEATAAEAETYVLFGQAGVEQHPTLTTVVDPAIPAWIRETIAGYAPRVTAYYAGRLGPAPDRPTVMASWNGPTAGRYSMGGSVLPGLIVASFEGEHVVKHTPELDAMARWFVGHESAHFWLGQAVTYEFERDMWITEGGADLMAVRSAKALDATYDNEAVIRKAVEDCAALALDRGVASAASRGEHRAHYACGAVFALAAEGAERRRSGGDWLEVVRALIDANRADGVLSRADWLDHFQGQAGEEARALVETLLNQGSADPAADIARLFALTGVAQGGVGGSMSRPAP